MEVHVHTGCTKRQRGTTLLSCALESSEGEKVCFLLQVEAKPEDAKTLEKEALLVIQHALIDTEGEASRRLDGALKELNGLLKGLTLSHTLKEVHMLLAILDEDNVFHVSHTGCAEAYVVRNSMASQITEYTRGKPMSVFVHIASGQLENRDVVVLSTQRLLRSITPTQLAQHAQREDHLIDELKHILDGEEEQSAFSVLAISSAYGHSSSAPIPKRGRRKRGRFQFPAVFSSSLSFSRIPSLSLKRLKVPSFMMSVKLPRVDVVQGWAGRFLSDLGDPKRKRRAHLLLLAGALGVLVIVWAGMQLTLSGKQSKTRQELEMLVEKIDDDIRSASNRFLAGDREAANLILRRAEERAKQVLDNERGLFRVEALDLLDRVRSKGEEINNIVRLSPRIVINLGTKNEDVLAQGIIHLGDGEFVAYDRQDLYHILLNALDDPDRLSDSELIVDGTAFPRYGTTAFLTTGNSITEIIAGQPTSMKTEDPEGWKTGKDIKAYLRFLYLLAPEENQIYKYERLSNRYGTPVAYNVNGDLSGGIDMTIDGNVYILKEGGNIVKLFRGEERPFSVVRGEDKLLSDVTKIFKVFDGHFYFLDPVKKRVIVSGGSGAAGESVYLKQFILEGEHVGVLQDVFVDEEETRLYVLDEKRLYEIDLVKK